MPPERLLMPPLPAQKAPQALGRRGVSPARGDGAKGQGPNANAMFAPVCGLMAWRVVRFTQGLGGWKSQCHARRHAVTCWSAECAWQIFPQGPMACGPNGVFSLMHAPWTTCHTLSRHALGGGKSMPSGHAPRKLYHAPSGHVLGMAKCTPLGHGRPFHTPSGHTPGRM